MPVTTTYPGVYVEELPSGVRTITGVSTSVTAFIGKAKRGPVNRAVRVQSFAGFERRFGGLSAESELSYAVRQFFLNGGAEAWIVRIALNAVAASTQPVLQNSANADVLSLTALEQGSAGNDIEVRIDHQAGNPASNFNLTLIFSAPDNPSDARIETFENLSMNPADPRFVETVVNGDSRLVTASKVHDGVGLGQGNSTGGALAQDVDELVDASHNRLRIVVDGGDAQEVVLDPAADTAGPDTATKLQTLCAAIQTATDDLTCAPNAGNDRVVITSDLSGETSSIRVLPGLTNDAAGRLRLGTLNGGTETDGAAAIRPRAMPDPGRLESGVINNAQLGGVGAASHRFQISLDGLPPETVSIGTDAIAAGDLADRRAEAAGRIETAVRAAKAGHPAFDGFTVTVDGNQLELASGTRGAGSSVHIVAADSDDVAATLNLLVAGTATATAGVDVHLAGGNEEDFTDSEAFGLFIGSRADREGLFALESVDLFNILCLPGVTDTGILMDADAYCRERRAFLIVDAPRDAGTPAEMETVALGAALPKSDHAAVYYPWIRIADPLKGGQLRTSAPCGTIAGLYARTDARRGVWKAPAGTEANLAGVQALEYKLSDPENGILNPKGVNALRNFPVTGIVAWGARTLRGANELASEWKYVPIRRLALMIEESLYRGTQWVVFEPNDEPLWAQIRLNVGAFMQGLFRQGAFQGSTPREAYLVKCDRETTTQDDIDRGVVNILVGFAPLKPAEFVILQIQQLAGNRS